jgi:CBS domain-containing protein
MHNLTVKDAMVKKVITATADQTVQAGAQTMAKNDVGLLVICDHSESCKNGVCENCHPIGIVTREDIVNKLIQHNKSPTELTLRDIMNMPVVTCLPADTVQAVAQTMLKYGFKRMPVIDSGKLVGLISYREIIKVTPDEVQTLHRKFLEDDSDTPIVRDAKSQDGNCEVCENFTDNLVLANGKWACETCVETSAEL